MCGIAGWAGWSGLDAGSLRAMCNAILHRGPDAEGLGHYGDVALGMRRLSIIDVEGGDQPVTNEDGSVAVVFNGEIYNFQQLRRRLERSGHRFRTRSDTEVLVHLYEERGQDLVDELRGMFSFALWDARRQRLLIARDRLGKKPLHYRVVGDGLAFASELKSLAAVGLAEGPPSAEAVARFLALGYVPDPLTIYPEIRKLPPAHTLTWSRDDGIRIRRYWAPPSESDPLIDEKAAVEELRRLFREAVRVRMVADVPIGAFLSGGIDSAAVVAEMVRQSDAPVDTYTIGFDDPRYNEAPAAEQTARALGTRHHQQIVHADIDSLIEPIACAFDEPFGDSSAIPTFLVSRLAAGDLKVVLSGDGGDELFGGYSRYTDFERRNHELPARLRTLIGAAARRLPHGARGRGRLLELAASAKGRYTGMVAHPLDVEAGGVAIESLARLVEWEDLLEPAFAEAQLRDPLGQLLHVDLLTYLPGDILTKVDRMSMACSLEARTPLLDHLLVEFAMKIPTVHKVRGGLRKLVLRAAFGDVLPSDVLTRPKSGFSLPISEWLRGPLRHRLETLAEPSGDLAQWVTPSAVNRIVREHSSGRRDHGALLWKLLVLDIWQRRQAQAESAASPRLPLVRAVSA